MIISEVMTREVRVASPDDTLQCVARVMEEEDFGSLPIAENDRLVGLQKGVVQLAGFVDSTAAKARAGELADSVDGVAQVRNDLEIRQK